MVAQYPDLRFSVVQARGERFLRIAHAIQQDFYNGKPYRDYRTNHNADAITLVIHSFGYAFKPPVGPETLRKIFTFEAFPLYEAWLTQNPNLNRDDWAKDLTLYYVLKSFYWPIDYKSFCINLNGVLTRLIAGKSSLGHWLSKEDQTLYLMSALRFYEQQILKFPIQALPVQIKEKLEKARNLIQANPISQTKKKVTARQKKVIEDKEVCESFNF